MSARRPGARATEIDAAERALGCRLPGDYRRFLEESDGFEGFVDGVLYLALWRARELHSRNEGFHVAEFFPGLTLLGTNGGGSGIGFLVDGDYVAVPLVGMFPDEVYARADTLEGLIRALTSS
jgi:hypothetical protein